MTSRGAPPALADGGPGRPPPLPPDLSDLEWMALHVEGLFVHDARGRLVRANTSQPPADAGPDLAPPRLFLGRTPMGALWRFAADVSPACVRELARLAAAEREDRPLEEPPERMAALVAVLERESPVTHVFQGPTFHFPAHLDPPPGAEDQGAGRDAFVVDANRNPLLEPHFPDLARALDARGPVVAVCDRESGAAVAVGYSATRPMRTAEVGVKTAPGFRGRGLATRVAADWARLVRARGVEPLYTTSWENRASLGVARRLGLIRFGVGLQLR